METVIPMDAALYRVPGIETMSVRNTGTVALFLLLTLSLLLPAGVRAHGEAEELFEAADVVLAPYVETPPMIDGSILPGEYSAYGRWVDEDTGLIATFVRDADSVILGLSAPGPGWIAIGFSSDLEEGMGFALMANRNGTFSAAERVAANVSDEIVFSSSNSSARNGIRAFNASVQSDKITAELQLPLESDLWTLEPGTVVPTVVAFNETSLEFPNGTEGSEVHFLRTYIFRTQDNPDEIRQLFAADISPAPGLVAIAVMTVGVGGVGIAFLGRRRVRP